MVKAPVKKGLALLSLPLFYIEEAIATYKNIGSVEQVISEFEAELWSERIQDLASYIRTYQSKMSEQELSLSIKSLRVLLEHRGDRIEISKDRLNLLLKQFGSERLKRIIL